MTKNGQITWTNDTRRLADLQPWEANPRHLTKPQAERLQASIQKFGYSQPIEIEPDATILDGHQREAVMALMKEYGPDHIVDVRVASRPFSLDERKEYIAQKHKGAVGSWDLDAMLNLYEGPDLLVWGFELPELEDMGFVFEKPEPADAEPQIDRAAELNKKWGVKLGDLWQIGEHRLLCGDSTVREDVERVVDEPAGLMVTDPPYGVEYDAGLRKEAAEKGLIAFAASREGKVENDERSDWSEAWALFSGDVAYCWHASLHASTVEISFRSRGFEPRSHIVWTKPTFAISRGHYHWRHELCIYAVRKGKTANWTGGRGQSTVWDISWDGNVDGGHSTQKPLECMARPIRNHDFEVVYDPFLGSGTTMVACENLGRRCRGIEISPDYCAVILERMQTAFPGLDIKRIEEV